MHAVTHILERLDRGDARAGAELLPLVYAELRQLAARKLEQEPPGQTLQATGLVHEAYLRLTGEEVRSDAARWESRGHFFVAAATAMRRILVENARRKRSLKRGGQGVRVGLDAVAPAVQELHPDLLEVDEALSQFRAIDPQKALLIELRFFAGLSEDEAAAVLGISRATASRHWTYARAWLFQRLRDQENSKMFRNS